MKVAFNKMKISSTSGSEKPFSIANSEVSLNQKGEIKTSPNNVKRDCYRKAFWDGVILILTIFVILAILSIVLINLLNLKCQIF